MIYSASCPGEIKELHDAFLCERENAGRGVSRARDARGSLGIQFFLSLATDPEGTRGKRGLIVSRRSKNKRRGERGGETRDLSAGFEPRNFRSAGQRGRVSNCRQGPLTRRPSSSASPRPFSLTHLLTGNYPNWHTRRGICLCINVLIMTGQRDRRSPACNRRRVLSFRPRKTIVHGRDRRGNCSANRGRYPRRILRTIHSILFTGHEFMFS